MKNVYTVFVLIYSLSHSVIYIHYYLEMVKYNKYYLLILLHFNTSYLFSLAELLTWNYLFIFK